MDYLVTIGQIVAIFGSLVTFFGFYKRYLSRPKVRLTSPLLDFRLEDLAGFSTPNLESASESLNVIPIELCNDDENRACTIRECFLEECFSWYRVINWLKVKFKGPPSKISLPLFEKLPIDLNSKNSMTLRVDMNKSRFLALKYKGLLTRIVVKHSRGTVKSKMFYVGQIFTYYFCVAESYSNIFVRDSFLTALHENILPAEFLDATTDVLKKMGFTEDYSAWKIVSVLEEESKLRTIPEDFLNLAKIRAKALEEFYSKFLKMLVAEHLPKSKLFLEK